MNPSLMRYARPRLLLRGGLIALLVALLVACSAPFSAERQYVRTVYDHAQRTLGALSTLQGLVGQPQIGDPAWESDLNASVDQLRGLIVEVRAMNPPSAFGDAHAQYVGAVNSLEQIIVLYNQAVAVRNNEQVLQMQQGIDQARQQLDAARERLQQIEQLQEQMQDQPGQ